MCEISDEVISFLKKLNLNGEDFHSMVETQLVSTYVKKKDEGTAYIETLKAIQKESVKGVLNSIENKKALKKFIREIIMISHETRDAINDRLKQDNFGEVLQLQLSENKKENEFFLQNDFFKENLYKNWLRLLGLEKIDSYNETVKKSGFSIFEKDISNSDFSEWVLEKIGEIEGKTILELGPGPMARDLHFFAKNGMKKCFSIENSEIACQSIEKSLNDDENILSPFEGDMYKRFKELVTLEKEFDIITSLSSIHYFSEQRVKEVLSLANKTLIEGGQFFVAVKKQETLFDKTGTPLEKIVDESRVLGLDGQIRYFRTEEAWKKLFEEAGFDVEIETGYEVDYEFKGQGEVPFLRIMATKKKTIFQDVQ